MSIIKKYSRKVDNEPKLHPITTRVTNEEYTSFDNLCKENGYTLSEGLRLLVKQELNSLDQDVAESTETYSAPRRAPQAARRRTATKVNTPHSIPVKVVASKAPTDPDGPKVIEKKQGRKRFVSIPWRIEDDLPCPLCDLWISASNYARHARSFHESTTETLLTTFEAKANQMVEDRKRSTQDE